MPIASRKLAELEQAARFDSAAELAEHLGQLKKAGELWEKACRFERAAAVFLRSGDAGRGLLLAARLDDSPLIEQCIDALATQPTTADATTYSLQSLGKPRLAARLQERLGNLSQAAKLYDEASAWNQAALLHLRAGKTSETVRCLEAALSLDADPALARLLLASLFERIGKLREAARLLQQIAEHNPLQPHALRRLARVLTKMDLQGSATETFRRLAHIRDAATPALEALADFEGVLDAGAGTPAAFDELWLGRYEIVTQVASSATARVYQAQDRVLKHTVALKLFSPSLISGTGRDAFFRFEREVRVLTELAHPAVVPCLAYHAEGPAVVLEWMVGGTLTQRLEKAPLSPRSGAAVAVRVFTALNAAHRRGILHRDIKPDNILFDAAGAAYLADFGTAHVADHSQTVTRELLGTLAYMAPAQRQGHAASIRSDVYAVGAVFWHILTGAPPEQARPFLCEQLSPEQQATARHLLDTVSGPASAAEAALLIQSQKWPNSVSRRKWSFPKRGVGRPQAEKRLMRQGDLVSDRLLDRAVAVVRASSDVLTRARFFAAADHERLVSILLFEPEKEELWLESLPIDLSRQLRTKHLEDLAAALTRLHEVGGHHGAVQRSCVAWRGEEPVLLFPTATTSATLQEDLARLNDLR